MTEQNVGYLAIYLNNFGGRRSRYEDQKAMQDEIEKAPAGIWILQEYDGYPALPESVQHVDQLSHTGEGGVCTAVRTTLGTLRLVQDYSFEMGQYRLHSRTIATYTSLHAVMIHLPRSHAGLSHLFIVNAHLHRMAAKEHNGSCKEHLRHFWNCLREAATGTGTYLLGGDFNMAVFKVAPRLRALGLGVVELHLPPVPDEGIEAPAEDCMGLFWVFPPGTDPVPPCACRINDMPRFDPDGRLLGHGSHQAVTAYLDRPGATRARTQQGQARHKERNLRRWQQAKAGKQAAPHLELRSKARAPPPVAEQPPAPAHPPPAPARQEVDQPPPAVLVPRREAEARRDRPEVILKPRQPQQQGPAVIHAKGGLHLRPVLVSHPWPPPPPPPLPPRRLTQAELDALPPPPRRPPPHAHVVEDAPQPAPPVPISSSSSSSGSSSSGETTPPPQAKSKARIEPKAAQGRDNMNEVSLDSEDF